MANLDLSRYKELLATIGRAGLNSVFPNEFEFYAIALEIVNSQGKSMAYLMFPINPDSLSISINNPISVSSTSAGVESLINPNFVPFDVTASGSFGRALRVVVQGDNILTGGAFGVRLSNEIFSSKIKAVKDIIGGGEATFSELAKTGYGVCKILEAIWALGCSVDENNVPYTMIMYNLSFNHNYIAEPMSISFPQDIGANNGFWRYNFSLKCVAPMYALQTKDEYKKISANKVLKNKIVSSGVKALASSFENYLPSFLTF
jgi:hypothetical protein